MTLRVDSKFMENIEEYLDVITPEKYIISNFDEIIEAEDSDRDDEVTSM